MVGERDRFRLVLALAAAAAFAIPPLAGFGAGASESQSQAVAENAEASARAATYIISIISGNATQVIDLTGPVKSATYGFQVKNTGDSTMPECSLNLTPWPFPPDKWSYSFIPSCPFSVTPGETKTELLVIYPAPDAEAKRYTFTLKGANGTASNQISINLDIKQYAGVEVIAPPQQQGYPGETLEFDFEIKNTGNGKDRFYITSVETGVPTMAPYLKDQSNWTKDLSAHTSQIKTVMVSIPYDLKTTGETKYKLSLAAKSSFCQTVEGVNGTIIHIPQVYDIGLGFSPQNTTILPGNQAIFTVTVINLGNGPDNITIRVGSSLNLANWTVSLEKELFGLQAGRQSSTRLKLTSPLNVLRGTYILEVVARSSGPGAPQQPVERSGTVVIHIDPVWGLSADSTNITAPSAVEPGGTVRIPFSFKNTGNGEDTVNITVVQAPLNWHAGPDISHDIRIAPSATHQAVLTVKPSASRNESLNQTYFIWLRVANADNKASLDLAFSVPVKPVFDWTVSVNGNTTAMVNLNVTRKQTFFLDIQNTGNAADYISLSFSGPNASWGRLDMPLVPLGIGEKRTVPVGFEVPQLDGLERKTCELSVRLASMNRPDLTTQATFWVNLRRFDPSDTGPVLEASPARPRLELGQAATAGLNVSVHCRAQDVANVKIEYMLSAGLELKVDVLTPPGDLLAGDNRTWILKFTSPSSDRDIDGHISVRAVADNQTAEWVRIPVKIKAPAHPGAPISMEAIGIALAVFLALGGLALGWNEAVMLALITQLLPLYSKIRREEVLDQYTRGKIHGYIIANPGEHYNSIKAQLKVKNGTLAYHLRVLEREGYVKSARDGPFKRFYPQEAIVPRNRSEFSSIQEVVLENVRASPGITQNDVAARMGVSSQVVNYHIRNLVRAGRIRLQREGRITRCYLK